LLRLKYNKIVICSGDPLQIPPPDGADYDLAKNSFIIDSLLDGNVIELNYLEDGGRFNDDTPDILKQIQATKRLPRNFENNVANLDMDVHLCLTNKKKKSGRQQMKTIVRQTSYPKSTMRLEKYPCSKL